MASWCGCKEVYRFHRNTYLYSSCICSFFALASLHFLKGFIIISLVPAVITISTTPTKISLSWTISGSEVDSYDVTWERYTSGECPDVDEEAMQLSVVAVLVTP